VESKATTIQSDIGPALTMHASPEPSQIKINNDIVENANATEENRDEGKRQNEAKSKVIEMKERLLKSASNAEVNNKVKPDLEKKTRTDKLNPFEEKQRMALLEAERRKLEEIEKRDAEARRSRANSELSEKRFVVENALRGAADMKKKIEDDEIERKRRLELLRLEHEEQLRLKEEKSNQKVVEPSLENEDYVEKIQALPTPEIKNDNVENNDTAEDIQKIEEKDQNLTIPVTEQFNPSIEVTPAKANPGNLPADQPAIIQAEEESAVKEEEKTTPAKSSSCCNIL
jgi:hypothetical protein